MLTQQEILTASLNDIIFQNRNKDYGAYAIRSTYDKSMKIALGSMLLICLMATVSMFWNTNARPIETIAFVPDELTLENFEPPIPIPPIPEPPAQPQLPEPVRSVIFTAPVITSDPIDPSEMMPPNAELDGAKIGLIHTDGDDYTGIVAPPVERKGTGLEIRPVTSNEDILTDGVVVYVNIEASFPGGAMAWKRYLEKNLRYPEQAIDAGISKVVTVQFVVDKEGNISEVKAINDPGFGLGEEAVRIIKRGPKWRPAEQNGRKVKYRQTQKITFMLEGL